MTAFTGFSAAVMESRRLRGADASVAVHTGYWGCGAFGGNRVLMILLQVTAARMAGLDRLVVHTGSPEGRAPLADALRILAEDLRTDTEWPTDDLIARVDRMAFSWGVSDGN